MHDPNGALSISGWLGRLAGLYFLSDINGKKVIVDISYK
jgi:hypothetical protein